MALANDQIQKRLSERPPDAKSHAPGPDTVSQLYSQERIGQALDYRTPAEVFFAQVPVRSVDRPSSPANACHDASSARSSDNEPGTAKGMIQNKNRLFD
jgi:hypothetical protein